MAPNARSSEASAYAEGPLRTHTSVAVIIPCFNDGATLTEAVRSAQSRSRIDELIVVNDGSTDRNTLDVIATLEAEGVSVIHRPNGGLAAARMSGVETSRADYVLPLDADDRLLPGALAALADELDRDASLAMVWGDYQLFGDRSYRQEMAPELDPWQITYQNDLPSSSMIRRPVLLAAGGWEGSSGYEDWNLWMSVAERSLRGKRIPIVTYEYRQHGVRMLTESASHHAEIYSLLQNRHPDLFLQRRAAWRRSQAPLSLRLVLPVIFALPMNLNRKRLVAGSACHLSHRRGLRLLLRRIRET